MASPSPQQILGIAPGRSSGAPTPEQILGIAPGAASPPEKKKKGRGVFGKIARYTGAELATNLAKDVGHTAIGVGPGLVKVAAAAGHDVVHGAILDPLHALQGTGTGGYKPSKSELAPIASDVVKQYEDFYGHDLAHHIYKHPLQPILDVGTALTGGAGGVVKVGKVASRVAPESKVAGLAKLGDRGKVVTRSPRAIATGKGPVHTDLTSTAPLVRAREQIAAKARARRSEGKITVGGKTLLSGVGGELKKYGKQIQAEATQKALGRTIVHEPYAKAIRGMSADEWAALHIRAMDIHPDDLAHLWKGKPLEAVATNPKIRALVFSPSKRMVRAEPQARLLSEEGAKLYKQQGRLKDVTAAARPELTKRQAAEVLGRPVKTITGKPYYFPHTLEPQRAVSPLAATGGGRGVPRKLGSMKENTGALALHGKLHLRSDVLGPEFLRRVKFVKYDEVHNALVRGAVRVTRQRIEQEYGGRLPQGYEYIREKASTRIPPTIRGEGTQPIAIDKLIPNAEDLHDSQLARDGFSTVDPAQAHTAGGKYYIAPKATIKAATGEFTRSSDFTRNFVKRPLMVWRAVVLGLRVGFLTNNLVGNSVMYTAKIGGHGALRDLFGAIYETHGPVIARKALGNAATPPALRADLTKEFFPEQVRGTFGRTQTPATSMGHIAGRKAVEGARAVTGAIPKVTSKVAEEYPRRALVRHYIRTSPEFKNVYSAMPKQTRTFEAAARQVLEGHGGAAYQRYVSKRVNQALGDYLGLSPAERNVIRNTIPFYSWYKAITTTTFHLAADTPLRANVLGQIGRIGKEQSDTALGEVPSFLRGALDLGPGKGGTKKVLATQGLNPYATLNQLRSGTTSDVTDLGLNPFLMAAAQAFAKSQQKGISPGKLTYESLLAMVRALPPSRLIAPMPPSKLYPNRGRRSELYSFLGAPIKEYNPSEATRQARIGR